MSAPTLSDAIDEFLLARRADGLAEKTLIWYAGMLRRFSEHMGPVLVDAVSTSALRRYIVTLRESDYAPDTIYAHIKALHVLFKWTAEEYNIPNPARHIAFPKQPPARMPKRAQDADIARLIAACTDDLTGIRDRAIIAFLTDTGCRAAGVVGLLAADLDMERRRAHVKEKGQKWRTVFFGPEAARYLGAWVAARDPTVETVFYNLRGRTALTPNGLLQLLRRVAKRAGVTGPVNPHSFRHRFGEKFMLAGGDSGVLQQMMGHSDVETTMSRYAQFDDEQLAAAHQKFVVKPLNQNEGNERSG